MACLCGLRHGLFEFAVAFCQFAVALVERDFTFLQMRQHLIETIGELPHLIVGLAVHTDAEILLLRELAHGQRQLCDGLDQVLL